MKPKIIFNPDKNTPNCDGLTSFVSYNRLIESIEKLIILKEHEVIKQLEIGENGITVRIDYKKEN